MPSVKRTLKWLAALLLLGNASIAFAQTTPYSTSIYDEGPGFRLGHYDLVIHPGLATEIGYDSNVFYTHSDTVGSAVLRLRAHVDLAPLSPQYDATSSTAPPLVNFRFSAQADYREYLSSNADVQAQRSVNVSANASVHVWPTRPFNLSFTNNFTRSVDPRNTESTGNYSSDSDQLIIAVKKHWSLLELTVSNSARFSLYENSALDFGDSYGDEVKAAVAWRFWPATTGLATVRFGFVNYPHETADDINSMPFRVNVGIVSAFTHWLSGSATIGYGASFSHGKTINAPIANVALSAVLPRQNQLTIDYSRDFSDTLFADGFVDDRFSLHYSIRPHPRVRLSVDGSVILRDYTGLIPSTVINPGTTFSGASRSDVLYSAGVDARVVIRDWLAVSLTYNLLDDSTNFQFINTTPAAAEAALPVSFFKQTVFLRIDVAY